MLRDFERDLNASVYGPMADFCDHLQKTYDFNKALIFYLLTTLSVIFAKYTQFVSLE